MSWGALQWAEQVEMMDDMNVNVTTARFVLLLLALRAGDCGHVWPGMKSIADTIGRTTRTVQTMVDFLSDADYIEVIPRNRYGQKTRTNLYEVLWPGRWVEPENCEICAEVGIAREYKSPYTLPPLPVRPRFVHRKKASDPHRKELSDEHRKELSGESYLIEEPDIKNEEKNQALTPIQPQSGWPTVLSERIPIFQAFPLTTDQVARLERDYEGVDFVREARRYTDWHLDHTNRIPTRNGRMNSLRNWLERADRRGSLPAPNGSRPRTPEWDVFHDDVLYPMCDGEIGDCYCASHVMERARLKREGKPVPPQPATRNV